MTTGPAGAKQVTSQDTKRPLHLVWWTTNEEHLQIGEDLPAGTPDYLCIEWRGLEGRNARGRLWISEHLSLGRDVNCEWIFTKPIGKYLSTCGGIVIRAEDAQYVAGLPGILTPLTLGSLGTEAA